jgi:hypothetical protein
VPRATRTPRKCAHCASFKGHSLPRRAKPHSPDSLSQRAAGVVGRPQDLTEQQRLAVERFFRSTISKLNPEPEIRLGATLMLALNTFLLRYGLDVTSRLRELHQGITPYFRQAWRSASKDAKMKVAEALASPGGIPRALDGPGLEHTSGFTQVE